MSDRPTITLLPLPVPGRPEIMQGFGIDRSIPRNIIVFAGANAILHLGLAATGSNNNFSLEISDEPKDATLSQPYTNTNQEPVAYQTTGQDDYSLLNEVAIPLTSLYDSKHQLIEGN